MTSKRKIGDNEDSEENLQVSNEKEKHVEEKEPNDAGQEQEEKGKPRKKKKKDDNRKGRAACGRCRKKKVKCHYETETDERCSKCTKDGAECTVPPRQALRPRASFDALESKVSKLESLVKELSPKIDMGTEGTGQQETEAATSSGSVTQPSIPSSNGLELNSTKRMVTLVPPEDPEAEPQSSSNESYDLSNSFFSRPDILQTLLTLGPKTNERPNLDQVSQASLDQSSTSSSTIAPVDPSLVNLEAVLQIWPDPKLLSELLNNYFTTSHLSLPILCERTFKMRMKNDETFTNNRPCLALTLLVLAVSTLTIHPVVDRERLPSLLALGSKWYNYGRLLLSEETSPYYLVHYQSIFLMSCYAQGTQMWQSSYPVLSYLQSLVSASGSHLKSNPKFQGRNELLEGYRRLFWCLYVYETSLAVNFNKPFFVNEEDFDLGYPASIDRIGEFVLQVDLSRITRMISNYFFRENLDFTGQSFGSESDQSIIDHLEREFQAWWSRFLAQGPRMTPEGTALLELKFVETRALAHSPFVTGSRAGKGPGPSSSAVIIESSRRVVDILKQLRYDKLLVIGGCRLCEIVFKSALSLLRLELSNKSRSLPYSFDDVKFCIEILQFYENSYSTASEMKGVLSSFLRAQTSPGHQRALANATPFPMQPPPSNHGLKAPNAQGSSHSQDGDHSRYLPTPQLSSSSRQSEPPTRMPLQQSSPSNSRQKLP